MNPGILASHLTSLDFSSLICKMGAIIGPLRGLNELVCKLRRTGYKRVCYCYLHAYSSTLKICLQLLGSHQSLPDHPFHVLAAQLTQRRERSCLEARRGSWDPSHPVSSHLLSPQKEARVSRGWWSHSCRNTELWLLGTQPRTPAGSTTTPLSLGR